MTLQSFSPHAYHKGFLQQDMDPHQPQKYSCKIIPYLRGRPLGGGGGILLGGGGGAEK